MDSFHFIQPSPLLSPFVKHYWFMTIKSDVQDTERVIPTGMMSLVFHRGNRIFSESENRWQPRAFISGHGISYTDLSYRGCIDMIFVEFHPAGAKAFFKMPMIELYNQAVAIDNLNDPLLVELEECLFNTANPETCVFLIENYLKKRLYQLDIHNLKRINAVMQSIYKGQQNIDMLAQTACFGYKQFKRLFSDYIGANPKDYLRIVRFQKALHILQNQPNINLTQLSFDCGYYDQSHCIKDFKQFSGYTPSEYLAVCEPHSDFFP